MPPYVGSFSCSLILSNNTILNNKFLLELHFKKQPLGNSNSTTKEDERMADGYHFLLIRLAVNNKQLSRKCAAGLVPQLGHKLLKGRNSSAWITATWVQNKVPGIQQVLNMFAREMELRDFIR